MLTTTALLTAVLGISQLASAVLIPVYANAAYDNAYGEVFEFVPNELVASIGDVLEFHFTGPGLGVLGGNHSVAMGEFGSPCMPAREGFFSGYMGVNATSKEANQIFQVEVTNTDPMVFYCTQGRHCAMGMFGVVNGAGDLTRQAYKDSIPTPNLFAMAPDFVGGGTLINNTAENILVGSFQGAAASSSPNRFSTMAVVLGLAAAVVIS